MPDPGVNADRVLPELVESEELRQRAEELERRLDRLVRMMENLGVLSHKINNPLTALLGRAQLLQMYSSDPRVAEVAGVIESSSMRVAEYVRELALAVRDGREEALGPLIETERQEA